MIDFAFFSLVSAAIGYLIYSESIKDGLIIKAGLILTSFGFAAGAAITLQDEPNMMRPFICTGIGLLICVIGVVLRALSIKFRRAEDWIERRTITK